MDSNHSDYYDDESESEGVIDIGDAPANEECNKESQEENENNDQNFQFGIYMSNVISGFIQMPPLIKTSSIFPRNISHASNVQLPPLPEIDYSEIHQDLRSKYINPFDFTIKNSVFYNQNENNSPQKSKGEFNWRNFQISDIPDIDDTSILETIHKKFDMAKLFEQMRKV